MNKNKTISFEFRATVIDKEIDEEILKNELYRAFKAHLIEGINQNFESIPLEIKRESRMNNDGKIETDYIIQLAIMNQSRLEHLIERQEKLELLLEKRRLEKRTYDSDDWISNKKVH